MLYGVIVRVIVIIYEQMGCAVVSVCFQCCYPSLFPRACRSQLEVRTELSSAKVPMETDPNICLDAHPCSLGVWLLWQF